MTKQTTIEQIGQQAQAEASTRKDIFSALYFSIFRSKRHGSVPRGEAVSVVLYDRSCPLCRLEMERLKRRDTAGRIELVDASGSAYDPRQWGFSRDEVMALMHVRRADGKWLVGVPALRHVYALVDLGWLLALTELPLLSPLADALYRRFAGQRNRVSAWLGLDTIVAPSAADGAAACSAGQCEVARHRAMKADAQHGPEAVSTGE